MEERRTPSLARPSAKTIASLHSERKKRTIASLKTGCNEFIKIEDSLVPHPHVISCDI